MPRPLALRLDALLGSVDYVISGLPILWFNRDKKAAILSAGAGAAEAVGRFHQFTYLGRPPVGPQLLARARAASHTARHRADEPAAGVRLSLRARRAIVANRRLPLVTLSVIRS